MKENKDNDLHNGQKMGEYSPKEFAKNTVFGFPIGVAFIIPGFSGGSVAAILGIYERLVNAIADIFKCFKKSVMTLLPIGIGMAAGILSLLFPLKWALGAYPIPTVCIFVGLALGGLPSITDKLKGRLKLTNVPAFLIPLALAFGLSFMPVSSDVDLLNLNFGGYVVLFLIGIVGSAALVVPGISGSMLLLIFGYYNPIVSIVTDGLLKGENVGVALSVLCTCGAGIVVGFFAISIIMKQLFKRCPRGTYFAILGFIIGSIPSVFASTAKEAGLSFSELMPNAIYWIVSALLLIIGAAMSLALVIYSKKRS